VSNFRPIWCPITQESNLGRQGKTLGGKHIHGYVMGSVDKTLFTLKHGNEFLLVQIYMDDIIFGVHACYMFVIYSWSICED
jgi:hypothetical protein